MCCYFVQLYQLLSQEKRSKNKSSSHIHYVLDKLRPTFGRFYMLTLHISKCKNINAQKLNFFLTISFDLNEGSWNLLNCTRRKRPFRLNQHQSPIISEFGIIPKIKGRNYVKRQKSKKVPSRIRNADFLGLSCGRPKA